MEANRLKTRGRSLLRALRSSARSAVVPLLIYVRYYSTIIFYKLRYPRQSVFETIYERRTWGGQSVSGAGSDLAYTLNIRNGLPALLRELGVRSLMDAPCGDYNWMSQVPLGIESYIGVDIVPELIAENIRKYGSERVKFTRADITIADLPRVDLILCRDCLPHLSHRDVFRVLRNFCRSGSTYILTSTYPGFVRRHWNILTGMYRPLDLELPPFDFPKPLRLLPDGIEGQRWEEYKCLGLWKLSDLAEALSGSISADNGAEQASHSGN